MAPNLRHQVSAAQARADHRPGTAISRRLLDLAVKHLRQATAGRPEMAGLQGMVGLRPGWVDTLKVDRWAGPQAARMRECLRGSLATDSLARTALRHPMAKVARLGIALTILTKSADSG